MKKELLLIAACLIMIFVSTGSLLAAEGPIKIGIYADLSAGSAQWGNDALKGPNLYIKEVNTAGGILGRKIEPIGYDCKMTPRKGRRPIPGWLMKTVSARFTGPSSPISAWRFLPWQKR